MKTVSVLLSSIALVLSAEAHASFRCESKIASEGDRTSEVESKCGQPASREMLGYTTDKQGNREMQIEEWVYGPINGMYYYLRFEGGRLDSVTSKRQQ